MSTTTTAPSHDTLPTTVGAIVADDFRTARVFERHGIDFCCGGKLSLAAVCQEKGLDPATLQQELAAVTTTPVERSHDYAAWPLPFLADYIINTHHAWLRENTGPIAAYAQKIARVHGPRHPETIEIATLFDQIATAMMAHLREEEEVLFPAVRRIDAARQAGQTPAPDDGAAIQASLRTLHQEHDAIGNAAHGIRRLSSGYTVPSGVCNTYRVTYGLLREFEADLHQHVHLENNILFAKAARL